LPLWRSSSPPLRNKDTDSLSASWHSLTPTTSEVVVAIYFRGIQIFSAFNFNSLSSKEFLKNATEV
jgi:hypothetical protein